MPEGVGFEPTVTRATLVFKTNTIDHSDTLPFFGFVEAKPTLRPYEAYATPLQGRSHASAIPVHSRTQYSALPKLPYLPATRIELVTQGFSILCSTD